MIDFRALLPGCDPWEPQPLGRVSIGLSEAHLGVARANALQTKNSTRAAADLARTRALAVYKDFLPLWKDADPEIPIYQQVEAEYAKLQ